MTPAWAWPLSVLFTLGWVLAAMFGIGHILRWLRQSRPTRSPGRVTPPRAPGHTPARKIPRAPGPAPNRAEADLLDGIARARITAGPQAVENSRMIADGLRLRFPDIPDTVLGLVMFDAMGYVNAALLGSTHSPGFGLQAISDAFALCAEELTRMARNEVPR